MKEELLKDLNARKARYTDRINEARLEELRQYWCGRLDEVLNIISYVNTNHYEI